MVVLALEEKYIEYGGPDGGDGGNGGDIVFRAVSNKNTLIDFRYKQHFKANRGKDGSGKRKKGLSGQVLLLMFSVELQYILMINLQSF